MKIREETREYLLELSAHDSTDSMIRSYKTDIESQLGPNINIVGSFFDYFIYDGVDVKIDIDKLIKDQKLFEGRLADGGDLVEDATGGGQRHFSRRARP